MNNTLTGAAIGLFAIVTAAPVLAQNASDPAAKQPTQRTVEQPAISPDETGAINRIKLAAGENSFTESQAKARIEGAGFTHVGTLTLDKQGIWRGTANKGAMTVSVGLDFKGNIAADNARAQ